MNVSLQLTKGKRHFCAGTILNSQWVLTAAHCFTFIKSSKDIVIQYGSQKLKPAEPQQADVEFIYQHEGYNPTVAIHDIALLKLKRPLKSNEYIKNVQLMEDEKQSFENQKVQLIGWGLNETMGYLTSKLHWVSLSTLSLTECRSQLQSVVHKSNLCAGGYGKGQCSGDSGGPLMLHHKQIGLVSWSLKPCGRNPGVFTNVFYYLDWIRNVMDISK